jgi:hypothetical protein
MAPSNLNEHHFDQNVIGPAPGRAELTENDDQLRERDSCHCFRKVKPLVAYQILGSRAAATLYFAGGAKGCCSRAGSGKITKSWWASCTRLSPIAWSVVCNSGRFE